MDTEKYNEIQEKVRNGKPVSDEGPYYHHVHWETYKGGVKGKLGGAIVGSVIGAVVGVVAASVLVFAGAGMAAAAIGAVAFTGMGMWKGMDEFSTIGKVAGGVSAGLDIAERRNKLFVEEKIGELKEEIHKIGGGEQAVIGQTSAKPAKQEKEPFYRLNHYVAPHDETLKGGPVFWKVAAIGMIVGIAAGGLLAAGGLATGIIGHIIGHTAVDALGAGTITALSMATFGAFGASFGINRDIFRQMFDKTDMLFRGLSPTLTEQYKQKLVAKGHSVDIPEKNKENLTPVLYEGSAVSYPESDTYHRDKLMEAAKNALMSLDHTKLPPH